jgi:hypothetical protein
VAVADGEVVGAVEVGLGYARGAGYCFMDSPGKGLESVLALDLALALTLTLALTLALHLILTPTLTLTLALTLIR